MVCGRAGRLAIEANGSHGATRTWLAEIFLASPHAPSPRF